MPLSFKFIFRLNHDFLETDLKILQIQLYFFSWKYGSTYQSWSNRRKPSIIDKNNYTYVGNGVTETKIYWRCSIEDCKNRDLLQAVERIKFLLKDLRLLQGRSTYKKLLMSWAGQPSKLVFSIILCRQIGCDIMFLEYNWKHVHKFDPVSELDKKTHIRFQNVI